ILFAVVRSAADGRQGTRAGSPRRPIMTRSTSIALSPEDIDAIAQRLLTLMHEQAATAPAATPAATPKASPKATKATKAKAKAPSGPRCTAIKPNGHRCRGRGAARGVGEDGLCEFHRK